MDLLDRSVPLDIIPHVFGSIGMIVVSWTFVENNLDAWSAITYHDHDGSSIEKKLPKPLSRKIGFLRKCFEQIDTLSTFTEEVIAYLDRVSALSETRHYVVHGVLSHYESSDASFLFMKIDMDAEKKQHIMGQLHILGIDLVKAGVELAEMAKTGQAITQRLLNATEEKGAPRPALIPPRSPS